MYGVWSYAECTAGLGSAATLWCDSGDREKAGRGLGTLHSTVLHAVVCCGSAFEFLKTNPDYMFVVTHRAVHLIRCVIPGVQ